MRRCPPQITYRLQCSRGPARHKLGSREPGYAAVDLGFIDDNAVVAIAVVVVVVHLALFVVVVVAVVVVATVVSFIVLVVAGVVVFVVPAVVVVVAFCGRLFLLSGSY